MSHEDTEEAGKEEGRMVIMELDGNIVTTVCFKLLDLYWVLHTFLF